MYQHSRLTDKLKRSTGWTGKCVTLNLLAIGLCRRALAPIILGVGDRLGISCDPSSPHSLGSADFFYPKGVNVT